MLMDTLNVTRKGQKMLVSELLDLFPKVNLFRISGGFSGATTYKNRKEIAYDCREVVSLDVDCSRELIVYVR